MKNDEKRERGKWKEILKEKGKRGSVWNRLTTRIKKRRKKKRKMEEKNFFIWMGKKRATKAKEKNSTEEINDKWMQRFLNEKRREMGKIYILLMGDEKKWT